MLVFPRILLGLLATLGLNLVLILWSVVVHFQAADVTLGEQQVAVEPADTENPPENQVGSVKDRADLPPELPSNLSNDPPNDLPDSLPNVPSLESAENDPGFQEFLDMAAEQFPELSHLKDSSAAPSGSMSREYYAQLEQRLKAVEQLTAAAVLLTKESRRFAAGGEQQRSAEFLQRITHLREIAADLLIEEL